MELGLTITIILLIIVVIVIVIVICKDPIQKQIMKFKHESTLTQSDQQKMNPNQISSSTIDSDSTDENSFDDDSEIDSENVEHFFAVGDDAFVDKQGDIVGSRILSNGMLNQPYNEIKTAIRENKPLKDNSVLGVSRGDDFETAYSVYKSIQDEHDKEPTRVRSTQEMSDIAKKISSCQNNANSCIFSRAGADKSKIKLDPLGTIGVCDTYQTPERDRNHKIYDGAKAVYVQGFDMDTSRINQELTSQPGWYKNFSPNTMKKVSSIGSDDVKKSITTTNDTDLAETFSNSLH